MSPESPQRPLLSVIVTFCDMPREAPRTLYSLSSAYQREVDPADYEVVVVENGSREPLGGEVMASLEGNFRHFHLPEAPHAPNGAINLGVDRARGEHVAIMIDGARMVTPGLIHHALLCLRGFPRPVVSTLGFHLGPDMQCRSVEKGYDQRLEDELLASIDWPSDGYRLFEIAAFADSSRFGWFRPMAESNALFLPKELFHELGGYDERFDLPGGGMVNLDFYVRACELPDITLITLLGEGNFHQLHGGVTVGVPMAELEKKLVVWGAQYERIRGHPFRLPKRQPLLFGNVPPQVAPWVRRCLDLLDAEDAGDGRPPPVAEDAG